MIQFCISGRKTIEFDERSCEAIVAAAEVIGCSVSRLQEIITALIQLPALSPSVSESLKDIAEIVELGEKMTDKLRFEYTETLKEIPEYCTFKSRLNPFDKRRSFQRPVFWKRIRSNPQRKPP